MLMNLRLAPGIFTEGTDRGSDGRWRDGNMVRWRNGLPEKVGGWDQVDLVDNATGDTASADSFALSGVARNMHDWSTLDGKELTAIGTNNKLYLMVDDNIYDITPLRASTTLTDPITTTSGSPVVTITHTAHGASAGDYVTFTGATAVGGITIDGEYVITDVLTPDTYTITHTSNASGNASGGGSVGVEYQISTGGSANGVAFGYGACTWGVGTFGTTRSACSTLIIPLRIWSLDNWGEDLIASTSDGPVYVWDRTLGFNSRAVLIDEAPAINQRVLVSPENRQLICLGTVDPDTGQSDPLFIEWSDSEDYTDFVITSTNNAGNKRIDSGSAIITGTRTRSGILVWTDESLHLMQPTGDSTVFSFREMGSGTTIAGPNAMVDVNGVVYYMGVDNFFRFDGVLQVMPCEIWSQVFNNFNVSQRRMVFCAQNKEFSEIWWFYPPAGQNENQKAAVYNYRENTWWFGNIERASWLDFSGVYEKPYAADNDGNIWKHESGVDETAADGTETAISCFLESDDIEIGEGEDLVHINKMIPDFKSLTGTLDLYLKARQYPGASQTTKGPYSITSSTTKSSVRIRGRQVALRISMDTVGDDFRMGTWRADGVADGKR